MRNESLETAPRVPHSAPAIGKKERNAVDRVLLSGQLVQGREVEAFEAECAACVGRNHGIAVNNGTAALHLALLALDAMHGSGVAQPSYACAALRTATEQAGADPVICDIDDTFNLDIDAIPETATHAIVTHLFGAPGRVPQQLETVEDLAQSLGGPVGQTAPVAICSFYATKMISTGEGGMVLTDDENLAEYIQDIRDYDKRDDYRVRFNYKMTDMQAAMGRIQLTRLPLFVERRRNIAAQYTDAFQSLPLTLPQHPDHVYYRYVVQTEQCDDLAAYLQHNGIDAKRPVHMPAHHYVGVHCPNAEHAHRAALSIPIYPAMDAGQVRLVIDSLLSFFT